MDYTSLEEALKEPKLSNVTTLNLTGQKLTSLPESIGKLTSLRVLVLADNQLKTLPKAISKLSHLSTLDTSNNQLEQLPENLKSLVKLQRLYLAGNKLKELPDIFGKMEKLRVLDISENQIKALPESMRKLSNLEKCYLEKNAFEYMPELLNSLPKLYEVRGFRFIKQTPKAAIQAFLKECKEADIQAEQEKAFLQIFTDNTREVAELSMDDLMAAYMFKNAQLRLNAKEYIIKRFEKAYAKKPIAKGAVVAFWGNTKLKKKEIQERLKNLEIDYSKDIAKEVTHLVLGTDPVPHKAINLKKQILVSEKQLQDALDSIDTPFLLEETEGVEHSKQNVEDMLLSFDENNVALGLEFLKSGGIPQELLTDLYIVYKLSENKKNKETAKKMLEVHAPKDVLKVMKDTSRLVSTSYDGEKKIYKTQALYAKICKSIDWLRVGFYAFRRFGNGLRYVLDHVPVNSPLKLEILEALIENDAFDYFKGYATYMPNYDNSFAYDYYSHIPFPKEIYQFTNLKKVNIAGCYIAEIPEGIANLANLEILDCHGNFLKSLPDELTTLKHLKEINLSDNEFEEFPMILTKMPFLQKISLRNNRKKSDYNRLKLPKEVTKALPDCTIEV